MNTEPKREDTLTLELLQAVEQRSDLSQRHLARHLGVALGLANSYLKRCVRKGLIKIIEAPANRYLYYLTPKGFAEKSRLTAEYLKYSFSFYRQASESCARVCEQCRQRRWQTLVLYGISDLAEIATLRAIEYGLTIRGLVDPEAVTTQHLGHPVWPHLPSAPDYDACLITDLRDPQAVFDALRGEMEVERILVPDVLRVAGKTAERQE